MRAALLAVMAIGTLSAIGTAPAEARDYPYCIKGRQWLSPLGDCSFSSYAQCQATASGRFAYCDVNPFYNSRNEVRGESRRYRRSADRYY